MKKLIFFTLTAILGIFLHPSYIRAEVTAQESARYGKIYYEYKQFVADAIKRKDDIKNISEEYFKKIKEKPLVIIIHKITDSGKSEILFNWADKEYSIPLATIHYAFSKTVHITKDSSKDIEYILLETNRNSDGSYDDGLYIKMAIKNKSL
jgi:hypothetical protein